MSGFIILPLLFSLSAFGCHAALGDEQYPCKPAPDINTVWYKTQKMDKTYKVRRYLGPHTLDIPYGYFTGRLTPERVNCTPRQDELEFAFWLPDLRSPQKDMWYYVNFRPQAEGPKPSGLHDYVVKILGMKFVEAAKRESESPFMAFSNPLSIDKIITVEKRYGLPHLRTNRLDGFDDSFADLSQREYKIHLDFSTPRFNTPPLQLLSLSIGSAII